MHEFIAYGMTNGLREPQVGEAGRDTKALDDVGYAGACEIEYERDFTDNYPAMRENVGYFRGIMDSQR